MKTKLNKIMILLQIAVAACVNGAVKIWAPVCGRMLELTDGRQVPMKCHWAGQAAVAVCVIIVAAAIAALLAKKEYKGLMIVTAVAAVMLFLVFGSLVGVCASETMPCQVTKVWGIGASIVVFVTSLINLFSGREGQIPS